MSMGGWMAFSEDDLNATNAPGMLTVSGDDVTQNVTLPFSFKIEGVNYSTLTLSTNGWIEFGGNTSGDSDPTNDCLPTAAPSATSRRDRAQTASSSPISFSTPRLAPTTAPTTLASRCNSTKRRI